MPPGLLLHADVDAFFASVVLRGRPDLVAVPMAVTAHVYVASANYVARGRGVRSGTLAQEALLQCPELILIEVPRAEVEDASEALFDLFKECAVAVEPGFMEEGFLDVGTSDVDTARAAADEIRRRAAAELGLPVSIGIGRTKLIAKLASRAAKPDGLRIIGPDEEARIRETLLLAKTWGVGDRTAERLAQIGATTLGDLDDVPHDDLERLCGVGMARRLRGFRDGTDDAMVRPVENRTALSAGVSVAGFQRPDHTPAELVALSIARVCHRAARAGLVGTGITLTFRPTSGGASIVSKHLVTDATADAAVWLPLAEELVMTKPLPPLVSATVTLTGLLPADQVPKTLF